MAQAQQLMYLIHAEMEHPQEACKVIKTVYGVSILGVLLMCIIMLLALGVQVPSISLYALPAGPGSALFVLLGVLIALTVVVLYMRPIFLFLEKGMGLPSRRSGRKWSKNAVRLSSLAFVTLLVYVGQADVASLMAVTGGVACIPIGLLMPPLFYNRLFKDSITPLCLQLHRLLLLLGTALGLLAAGEALRTWGSATNFRISCASG